MLFEWEGVINNKRKIVNAKRKIINLFTTCLFLLVSTVKPMRLYFLGRAHPTDVSSMHLLAV